MLGKDDISVGQRIVARGLYGIQEPGHVQLFAEFARFVDVLTLRLGNGAKAQTLAAYGEFEETTVTLSARRESAHMAPAP